jgi:inner membrane protein
MMDPFHWSGVVETRAFFALAPVDSLTPEVDPEGRLEIHPKPEETATTLAAKRSYLGHIYLDWAQYPITETEALPPPQEGYIVHLIDLRYMNVSSVIGGNRGRPALTAGVELDKNLNVIGDVFGTGKNQSIEPDPAQH